MDYNKILIDLIEQRKTLLMNDNEKYSKYMLLFDKLKEVLVDCKNVTKIEESEISLFNNPNAVRYIAGIDHYSKYDNVDKSEFTAIINKLKEMLLVSMDKDEDIKQLNDNISSLNMLFDKLKNNEFDSELLFDFIKKCYIDRLIDIETAVGLNLYIAQECSNKSHDNEEDEIVILKENENSILEDLRNIFSHYGYDYDNMKLNKKVREKLEKYARIDYLDFVLSILKENNITVENFEDRQGSICDIIIFNDKEALTGINSFVQENNCTLLDLLGMSGIFHKRQRKFKFKSKDYIGGSPNDSETIPGEYDSFMKNVEIYKKFNNLPADHKMTKIDFENRTKFFTTPHVKILENLSILTSYGVLEDSKIPGATSCLIGANIQYLLDRCIELGLFDYCKKNFSFLELDSKEFRWYKIKRSIDLGHSLFRGRGLRKELKFDSDFYGISFSTNNSDIIIHQIPMTRDEMAFGSKDIHPDLFKAFSEDPTCDLDKIRFNLLYKYRTFDVFDLFKVTNISLPKLSLIRANIYKRTNIDSSFLEQKDDEYIKLLDEAILYDSNGEFYNCKVDDRTYQFVNAGYPGAKVLISRYKVLQLVKVLKEENLWLDETFSEVDKVNLLLSILLKGTIVSQMEMQVVRETVRNILNGELKRIVSERKGNGR